MQALQQTSLDSEEGMLGVEDDDDDDGDDVEDDNDETRLDDDATSDDDDDSSDGNDDDEDDDDDSGIEEEENMDIADDLKVKVKAALGDAADDMEVSDKVKPLQLLYLIFIYSPLCISTESQSYFKNGMTI